MDFLSSNLSQAYGGNNLNSNNGFKLDLTPTNYGNNGNNLTKNNSSNLNYNFGVDLNNNNNITTTNTNTNVRKTSGRKEDPFQNLISFK